LRVFLEEAAGFLEEAAGVSKYKERRRETETRIRHTRENLERLRDVRDELGRQLQHLQCQARAAGQYREYRAEERRLKAELLTLRWRSLRSDLQAQEQALRQQETALEAILAEQRRLEAQLEIGRARRTELNEAFNDNQGRYYQAGAEIGRLEQYLQHQRDLRRRREDDWRHIAMALEQIDAQLAQDRVQQGEWTQALTAAEPELARFLAAETDANAALASAESVLREGQAAWEEFGQRNGDARRQADVERARIEHLERQLLQGERRLERLQYEQEQLAGAEFDDERAGLQMNERAVAEALRQDQEQLAHVEAELIATRDALRDAEQLVRLSRERAHMERGRLASLQTLQEAALGRHANDANDWLRSRQLDQAPRLAERIEVESGWEAAAEAVLTDWLDAVCVPDLDVPARTIALDVPARTIAELAHGRLALFEPSTLPETDARASGLATKVRAPWPLADFLDGVSTANDLTEMLARRTQLRDGEIVVTPDGVLCGRHSMVCCAAGTGCGWRAAATRASCGANGKSVAWRRNYAKSKPLWPSSRRKRSGSGPGCTTNSNGNDGSCSRRSTSVIATTPNCRDDCRRCRTAWNRRGCDAVCSSKNRPSWRSNASRIENKYSSPARGWRTHCWLWRA